MKFNLPLLLDLPDWAYPFIFAAFFGIVVLIIILVKRNVKVLQIKKDEVKEEDYIREELDRILVPVDDDVQRQMDEAAKKNEQ